MLYIYTRVNIIDFVHLSTASESHRIRINPIMGWLGLVDSGFWAPLADGPSLLEATYASVQQTTAPQQPQPRAQIEQQEDKDAGDRELSVG